MSFTALKDATDLGHGTIQHHVRNSPKLERRKNAIVHSERCSNCPLRGKCREKCVFKLLENSSRRHILQSKLSGSENTEIADELGVHRSTVTYHLSDLPEMNEKVQSALKEFFEN